MPHHVTLSLPIALSLSRFFIPFHIYLRFIWIDEFNVCVCVCVFCQPLYGASWRIIWSFRFGYRVLCVCVFFFWLERHITNAKTCYATQNEKLNNNIKWKMERERTKMEYIHTYACENKRNTKSVALLAIGLDTFEFW